MRKIRWTQKQREILHLVEQGLSDPEIQAKGHGLSSIARVRRNVKAGLLPPHIEKSPAVSSKAAKQQENKLPEETSTDRPTIVQDKVYQTVSVGELVIEPQVWRINQYGGFLILNTHAYARKKYGYTGTIGDFLCDACQIARAVMGMDVLPYDYIQEEESDGRTQTSEGGEVPADGGSELVGQTS